MSINKDTKNAVKESLYTSILRVRAGIEPEVITESLVDSFLNDLDKRGYIIVKKVTDLSPASAPPKKMIRTDLISIAA